MRFKSQRKSWPDLVGRGLFHFDRCLWPVYRRLDGGPIALDESEKHTPRTYEIETTAPSASPKTPTAGESAVPLCSSILNTNEHLRTTVDTLSHLDRTLMKRSPRHEARVLTENCAPECRDTTYGERASQYLQ